MSKDHKAPAPTEEIPQVEETKLEETKPVEKQAKKKTVYVLPDKTEIVFPCRLKSSGLGSFTDTEGAEPVRYSATSTKRAVAPQKGSWLASQLDAGNIVVEGDDD